MYGLIKKFSILILILSASYSKATFANITIKASDLFAECDSLFFVTYQINAISAAIKHSETTALKEAHVVPLEGLLDGIRVAHVQSRALNTAYGTEVKGIADLFDFRVLGNKATALRTIEGNLKLSLMQELEGEVTNTKVLLVMLPPDVSFAAPYQADASSLVLFGEKQEGFKFSQGTNLNAGSDLTLIFLEPAVLLQEASCGEENLTFPQKLWKEFGHHANLRFFSQWVRANIFLLGKELATSTLFTSHAKTTQGKWIVDIKFFEIFDAMRTATLIYRFGRAKNLAPMVLNTQLKQYLLERLEGQWPQLMKILGIQGDYNLDPTIVAEFVLKRTGSITDQMSNLISRAKRFGFGKNKKK